MNITSPITYQQLCKTATLQAAWEQVRAKGTAGGIDQVSVKDFGSRMPFALQELQAELLTRTYVPEPYMTIFIPKNNKEKRQLGLLTIRDKIVQQALLDMLSPVLDRLFLDCSYGYRPNKGPVKAVKRVWHMISNEKKDWFVKLDFDNFFDHIPHAELLQKLRRSIKEEALVKLIQLCLQMGSVEKNLNWTDRTKGVPQGALLSPLLSNLYLHDMDQFISQQKIAYVRYADDFILLAKGEKAATQARKKVEDYIQNHLHLPLNTDTQVSPLQKGLRFLGISFYKNHYGLATEKMRKLKAKLTAALQLKTGALPSEFEQTFNGIKNYYGRLIAEDQLMPLDQHIKKRLEQEIKKHKRIFRTQKSVRLALSQLVFFSSVFESAKKEIIKQLSGSKRLSPLVRQDLNIQTYQAIQKKKAAYQKLQSAAIELSINQPGVMIGLTRNRITVKKKGKNLLRAPTANVKYISIFSGGILLSSNLIHYCAKNDIPIDLFKNNGRLSARLYDPVAPNQELWQAQLLALSDKRGVQLAKIWVKNKINNQIKLLKYFQKSRKEDRFFDLVEETVPKMKTIRQSINLLPEESLKALRLSLFGKEGSAANYYWEAIAQLLPPQTAFKGRTRKGANDLINVLLNYGYGILYSRMWDALLRAELNPYISYLHTAQKGKPTLSFDLIEEFRQSIVDRTVVALVNRRTKLLIKNGQLAEESRKRLVNKILERLNSFENFRGQKMRLSDIIKVQAKALASYLQDPTLVYKPYAFKW